MERYVRQYGAVWSTECGLFSVSRAREGEGWEMRLDPLVPLTEGMREMRASGVLDATNRWPTREAAFAALDEVLRATGSNGVGRIRSGGEWQTLDGTLRFCHWKADWSVLVKETPNTARFLAHRLGFPTRRAATEWGRERQAAAR